MKRGIIIADPIYQITAGGGSTQDARDLDRRIRYCLMYWDRIKVIESDVFPVISESMILQQVRLKQIYKHNIGGELGLGLPAFYDDISYLRNIGLLDLERIGFNDQNDFKSVRDYMEFIHDPPDSNWPHRAHVDWVADRIQNIIRGENSIWSVDYYGKPLDFQEKMLESFITADIAINNCLPVPSDDVPIVDIIEFKERRNDELESFRYSLEELRIDILNSSDIPRSKNHYITKLNRSILDLNKVSNESWSISNLASCKMSLDLNLGKISTGVITASLVGSIYSSPVTGLIAGVLHTLASSLKFEIDILKCLPLSSKSNPELQYLSLMRSEGFI